MNERSNRAIQVVRSSFVRSSSFAQSHWSGRGWSVGRHSSSTGNTCSCTEHCHNCPRFCGRGSWYNSTKKGRNEIIRSLLNSLHQLLAEEDLKVALNSHVIKGTKLLEEEEEGEGINSGELRQRNYEILTFKFPSRKSRHSRQAWEFVLPHQRTDWDLDD